MTIDVDATLITSHQRQRAVRRGRKSKLTRFHRVFANNLLKICPALWTFVTVAGVEPTNTSAERALRGPVIYRRVSHGTPSNDGERFIERIVSASVTCRLAGRSLFTYLREVLGAHVAAIHCRRWPDPSRATRFAGFLRARPTTERLQEVAILQALLRWAVLESNQ